MLQGGRLTWAAAYTSATGPAAGAGAVAATTVEVG
jgi:hypothetical protein